MITSQKLRRAIPRLGALLVFLVLLFVCADVLAFSCYDENSKRCAEAFHRWTLHNACSQGDESACRELRPWVYPPGLLKSWLRAALTTLLGGLPSLLATLIWQRLPASLTTRRGLFDQATHMAVLWTAWYGTAATIFLAVYFTKPDDLKHVVAFSLGFMPLMLCWLGGSRASEDLIRRAEHMRVWGGAGLVLALVLSGVPWVVFGSFALSAKNASYWFGIGGGLLCGMIPLWLLHQRLALRFAMSARAQHSQAAHLSRLHERL